MKSPHLERIKVQPNFPEVDLSMENMLLMSEALHSPDALSNFSEEARKHRKTLLRGRVALNTVFYRLYPGPEYRVLCAGANVFEVVLDAVAPSGRDTEDRQAYLTSRTLSHAMNRDEALEYAQEALWETELVYPNLFELSRNIGVEHHPDHVRFMLMGTSLARQLESDIAS